MTSEVKCSEVSSEIDCGNTFTCHPPDCPFLFCANSANCNIYRKHELLVSGVYCLIPLALYIDFIETPFPCPLCYCSYSLNNVQAWCTCQTVIDEFIELLTWLFIFILVLDNLSARIQIGRAAVHLPAPTTVPNSGQFSRRLLTPTSIIVNNRPLLVIGVNNK